MNDSPFVVVRFAAGSGGRFVSTMLQNSNDIAHWNPELEQFKNTSKFQPELVNYLQLAFPEDPKKHLRVEPDLPYVFDFYSSTYDRGNDVTYEEYCEYHRAGGCNYFFDHIAQGKKANLLNHKSQIIKFMEGAIFVNIIIDSPRALDWTKKLLWDKHYQVVDKNTVRLLPHDPTTCNVRRSHLVEKYYDGSPYVKVTSIEDFYNEEIGQRQETWMFQDTGDLYAHPSNSTVTNLEFYLDNIFDEDLTIDNFKTIFQQADLEVPNLDLLRSTYRVWWPRQSAMIDSWRLNEKD